LRDVSEIKGLIKVTYKQDGDRFYGRACCNRTRCNGFKLKEGIFSLDKRKNFFIVWMVKHWNRLPKEVVNAPYLEIFKVKLDRALSNTISLKLSLLVARGLD